MSLISMEVKELRMIIEQVRAGTISDKKASIIVNLYNQVDKRAKTELMAAALVAKFGRDGKAAISGMRKINLIGNGSVIDLCADIDKEVIECPDQEKNITRMECKEFSETTGNLSTCETCPNFKMTRRLLKRAD